MLTALWPSVGPEALRFLPSVHVTLAFSQEAFCAAVCEIGSSFRRQMSLGCSPYAVLVYAQHLGCIHKVHVQKNLKVETQDKIDV